jgi:hypothetical protein
LTWLCEADLPSTSPERCAPRSARRIRALAGDDPLPVQEYTDLFTGRTLRRSVLVHTKLAVHRTANAGEALLGLHVTSASRLAQPSEGASGTRISADRPAEDAPRLPVLARTLAVLSASYPSTVPVAELIRRTAQDREEAHRVRDTLLDLAAAGRVLMSTTPLVCGLANGARPNVWRHARLEATDGQPWVTTLQHGAVVLEPAARNLLPLIDGTRDRAALVAAALPAVEQQRYELNRAGETPPADGRGRLAIRLVQDTLSMLETNALLEAE